MSVVTKVALGLGAYAAFVTVVLSFFCIAKRSDEDAAEQAAKRKAAVVGATPQSPTGPEAGEAGTAGRRRRSLARRS